MVSQTLDILRQGVWASLTGGWFYDPHQDVFCNTVHLYLWLFLLCTPFVTYLYFPKTFTTWGLYCFTTAFTITVLKIINMALHVLYDKAQAMSDPNIKKSSKNLKENDGFLFRREDECGIEMQVLPSRASVEQIPVEMSGANSMISIDCQEPINSTMDLKVDVHRKNSSESSDSFAVMLSGGYMRHSDLPSEITVTTTITTATVTPTTTITSSMVLPSNNARRSLRVKSKSEEKPSKNPSISEEILVKNENNNYNYCNHDNIDNDDGAHGDDSNDNDEEDDDDEDDRTDRTLNDISSKTEGADVVVVYSNTVTPVTSYSTSSIAQKSIFKKTDQFNSVGEKRRKLKSRLQKQNSLDTAQALAIESSLGRGKGYLYTSGDVNDSSEISSIGEKRKTIPNSSGKQKSYSNNSGKLQRHRSSETTDEQQIRKNRTLFLGHSQDQQHHQSSGGDVRRNIHHHHHHRHHHLQSLTSDLYLENAYTKSDFGIENIDKEMSKTLLLQQSKVMRKDSSSTMSALQLPVAASSTNSGVNNSITSATKKRRHSNAGCSKAAMLSSGSSHHQQPMIISNVRRIKSAALEISCPQPSVSNLCPHPNSAEVIPGQQIKNPQSAVLPPPSKCLVRNPHLNLCPPLGGSFGVLNEPVYPIAEQADERSLNSSETTASSFKGFTSVQIDSEHEMDKAENRKKPRNSITEFESDPERRRSQSTDSETENNGSRSPLLSGNKSTAKIVSENHHKCSSGGGVSNNCGNGITKNKNLTQIKNIDSGCPSSDCEQASASSKDMLLSKDAKNESNSKFDEIWTDNLIENHLNNDNSESGQKTSKNLGAIPKKFTSDNGAIRKLDSSASFDHEACASSSMSLQKHGTNLGAVPKVNRRTSSASTSSRSFSAESFCNELFKSARDQWITVECANNNINNSDSRGTTMPMSQNVPNIGNAGVGNIDILYNTMTKCYNMRRTFTDTGNFRFQPKLRRTSAITRRTFDIGDHHRVNHRLSESKFHQLSSSSNTPASAAMTISLPTEDITLPKFNSSDNLQNTEATDGGSSTPPMTLSIQRILSGEGYSFESCLTSAIEQRTSGRILGRINVGTGGRGNNSSSAINGGGGTSGGPVLNLGHVEFNDSSVFCGYFPPCNLSNEKPAQPKRYYKYTMNFFGSKKDLKLSMDRLQLLALFDRDLHWIHVVLAIILSTSVCLLGSMILQLGFYKDIFAFLFCIVIAGSQYSLLKSVQPDAASPIHGFNKTVSYSRPIYFCICSGLLLFVHHLTKKFEVSSNSNNDEQLNFVQTTTPSVVTTTTTEALITAAALITDSSEFYTKEIQLFGIVFSPEYFLLSVTKLLSIILLLFPIFFSLGLFPQINTFCMYLLEQIDMHVFGGSAACSLSAVILSCFKALLAIGILYGPAFGALSELSLSQQQTGVQHFLFSMFCALLIPISYHLSRCASGDFIHIWRLLKSCLVLYSDDDEDDDDHQVNNAVNNQSKQNDLNNTNTVEDCSRCISSNEKLNNESVEIDSSGIIADVAVASDIHHMDDNGNYSNSKRDCGAGDFDSISKSKQHDNDNTSCTEMEQSSIALSTRPSTTSSSTTSSSASTNGSLSMTDSSDPPDPLPKKLQNTVNQRLKNDLVVSSALTVIILALHCSTVFTVLQPDLNTILHLFAAILGVILHYIIPQMRKHLPWLCFAHPILKQNEFGRFEVCEAAKIMWFEKIYVCLCFFERNILYPLIFISALTADSIPIIKKFGIPFGTAIVVICGLKCIRGAYADTANQYLILIFSALFFKMDYNSASETFLVDYFVVSIFFKKACDFLLKVQFIVTYIAPWQITWGSAFHAFAQPFSVPHSAMLFLQAAISAILSTPLNPFLGSAIFLTSYVRPIKFWERDYNTRRIDHSNTRLSSQLERDLGADDNNLNSIFYEHLTRSLQHSLCGDLILGRWGNVNQGDCFVLASDYLNCLVHIIELGNGLCTFQMRGLEFRGTYCQQREVEAISEEVQHNDGCCCCSPGHIPKMLSANAMFSTRWLAWQVVAAQYVLEGYSISENLATATLQVFEFRKVLITYYVKSIIYYVTKNKKLEEWLASGPIQEALQSTLSKQFVDLDPIFNFNLDEDFDFRALGITRQSYCSIYLSWIQFCYVKRKEGTSKKSNRLSKPAETQPETTSANPAASKEVRNSDTEKSPQQHQQCQQQQQQQYSSYASSSAGDATAIGASATETNHSETVGQTKELNSKENNGSTKQKYENSTNVLNDNGSTNGSIITKDSPLVSLCLALGLLARRSLATASHSSLSGVEFFLNGLHALFKGDFRITSPRDEWVFADMELLHGVVAPAVKMALKLHQDHFSSPDEYLDPSVLYEAITSHSQDLVISHEADPVWRSAVLKGAPNLLALRHVMEDGTDEYRIIRLTKRFLCFRVIKLNRECVRGLWAGQQQELIYLRNRNPERGSIQNAKQALRNIINSSCDQPIGYPIYVSPLTTSYAETNEHLCRIIGGSITLDSIRSQALDFWKHLRQRCREGCSSGSGAIDCDATTINDITGVYFSPATAAGNSNIVGTISYGSQSLSGAGTRGSLASMNKPTSSTLLAGFLSRERDQERESVRDRPTKKSIQSRVDRERERRATLPITSSAAAMCASSNSSGGGGCGGSGGNSSRDLILRGDAAAGSTNSGLRQLTVTNEINSYLGDRINNTHSQQYQSIRKTSCSAGNLGESHSEAEENLGGEIGRRQDTKDFTTRNLIELNRKVIIVNCTRVYENLHYCSNIWPNEKMRSRGNISSWKDWWPEEGTVGYVVHYWIPKHPEPLYRSIVNSVMYLVKVGEHYVPILEDGIKEYNQIPEINVIKPSVKIDMNLGTDKATVLFQRGSSVDNGIEVKPSCSKMTSSTSASFLLSSPLSGDGGGTNVHQLENEKNISDTNRINFTNNSNCDGQQRKKKKSRKFLLSSSSSSLDTPSNSMKNLTDERTDSNKSIQEGLSDETADNFEVDDNIVTSCYLKNSAFAKSIENSAETILSELSATTKDDDDNTCYQIPDFEACKNEGEPDILNEDSSDNNDYVSIDKNKSENQSTAEM